MWCHFCKCNDHASVECGEYATEEERNEFAKENNLCLSCFAKSASIHSPGKECKSNENCGGWYSLEHHTTFCPKRVKGQPMFFPKIDEILWTRFAKMLDPDQKFTLMLSSPQSHKKYITLNNINVMDTLHTYHYYFLRRDNPENILYIINTLFFVGSSQNDFFQSIKAKTSICQARVIKLKYSNGKTPAQDLLQLFSIFTKEIDFKNYNTDITCAEIFKNAPNIEVLKSKDGSVKNDGKSWITDLLQYKSGKNFRQFSIYFIDLVEFDVESLAKFFATKCVDNVKIEIQYKSTEKFQNLKNKLMSNNFIEKRSRSGPNLVPQIIFGFDNDKINGHQFFTYNPRNPITSAISARRDKRMEKKVLPDRTAKKPRILDSP